MMARLLQLSMTAFLLAGFVSCAQLDGQRVRDQQSNRGGLSATELSSIKQQLVSHPLPQNPTYVRVRQACIFFVNHPEDGSMVPIGMVRPNAYVVLTRKDGEWVDVQLTSGQRGSLISNNVRNITTEEDASQGYLAPQESLAPLSLPQADASPIDTTLLGS